jgi:hypothetical protein
MGKHGCGKLKENGERLINICLNNKLTIGGTIFQHRDIHKLMWKYPDGKTVNHIDHVMINKRWRSSLKDVRVVRGADMLSDHFLVGACLSLKLKVAQHQHCNTLKKFNVGRREDKPNNSDGQGNEQSFIRENTLRISSSKKKGGF